MRLTRQPIQVRSRRVLVCDSHVVEHDPVEPLADGAVFPLWEGDGSFSIYTDGESYFVDVDPRILKARSRPELTRLSGQVSTNTAHIGIYDLTAERAVAADDAILIDSAVVIKDLDPATHVAWFDEKGTAIESFRGVIGFGRHVTMLLNGDLATQL